MKKVKRQIRKNWFKYVPLLFGLVVLATAVVAMKLGTGSVEIPDYRLIAAYTCENTSGQYCQSSCNHGDKAGSGTCKPGQKCCKENGSPTATPVPPTLTPGPTVPTAVPTVCGGCVKPNSVKTCDSTCPAGYTGFGEKCVTDYNACTGDPCGSAQCGIPDSSCGYCWDGVWGVPPNLTPTCQPYTCTNISCAGYGGCGSATQCSQSNCGVDCSPCTGTHPTAVPTTKTGDPTNTPVPTINPTCNCHSAGNKTTAATLCSDQTFECQPTDGVTWCYGQLSCATPSLDNLVLKNSDGAAVEAENDNENHICQNSFANSSLPRRIRFEANVIDLNGYPDIASVALRWNGETHPMTYVAGSGSGPNATYAYNWDFTAGENGPGILPLEVDMVSVNGGRDSGWVDADRYLKVWDCQVSLSGIMFDSSVSGGAVCSTGAGFTNLASGAMNFTGVMVAGVGKSTVVAATDGVSYSGASVIWGRNYTVTPNADLLAGGVVTRWQDWGSGSPVYLSCGVGSTVGVDAYAGSPTLEVDMAAAADQGPWFQVRGGGIFSKNQVADGVPATCAIGVGCSAAMSVSSATCSNGLVAAPVVVNDSGCLSTVCSFGLPNNWNYPGNAIGDNFGYNYFYGNYFTKTGLGYTIPGDATMTQIVAGAGGTGVVLVKGSVNVDINNAVDAATGQFLMIVASGTINIGSSVTQTEGILVADGGIAAGGTTDYNNGSGQLRINGIVYAAGNNVSLTRGYTDMADNNSNPGVLVTYRPDLIFSLPPSLSKVLTSWSQGK